MKTEKISTNKKKFSMPHTYALLFGVIVICTILTWILPAGEFERVVTDTGRSVVVPGTFTVIESTPVGPFAMMQSMYAGIKDAASIIALVAIFKSFFGHYLGTLEGLNGLILKFGYKGDKKKVSVGKLNTISMVFIMGSTWIVAYANPNILDLIEAMGAPIIASLLCLLPMYAIRKAPALAKYKGRTENIFVTVVGLLTILNIVYKLF